MRDTWTFVADRASVLARCRATPEVSMSFRLRHIYLVCSLAYVSGACDDAGVTEARDAVQRDGEVSPHSDGSVTGDSRGPDEVAEESAATQIRFDPQGAGFTATPWPTDRLRGADGHVDLSNFPGFGDGSLVDTYLAYGEEVLDGWGRNSAIYFELMSPDGAGIAAADLPEPRETLTAEAALQLVDVSSGPTRGTRIPVESAFRPENAADPFFVGPTLAMRPVYGFPLADARTYCAWITRDLKDSQGNRLASSPTFAAALTADASLQPLVALFAEEDRALDTLAGATCFTTQDATRELRVIGAFLATYPVEPVFNLAYVRKSTHYYEFTGRYRSPNFQSGAKPYRTEGGDFHFDAAGVPVVAEVENLRVRLLIPTEGEMPAAGWPVVLYAHGTGGDWATCRSGGESEVVREGLAMLCIDQPLHGDRRADRTQPVDYMDSFNFLNPRSGRTSFRQSAIDTIYLSRLVSEGIFTFSAEATGEYAHPVALDPERIAFFGHSHGGLSGVLALALDPHLKAGVLSGASGVMTETILLRKDTVDISAMLALVLGIDEALLDTFHPVLTLAQTLVDATDPINYAPLWHAPLHGGVPKHVFMTTGTRDAASPSVGAVQVAAAGGLDLVTPVVERSLAHELRNLPLREVPLSLNAEASDGTKLTAAIKQFSGGDHWVALNSRPAITLWRSFLGSFAATGVPTLGR